MLWKNLSTWKPQHIWYLYTQMETFHSAIKLIMRTGLSTLLNSYNLTRRAYGQGVSGPSLGLGSWVGCSGCLLVLDHLFGPLLTQTTSSQCPTRRRGGAARGASSKPAPLSHSPPEECPQSPDHPHNPVLSSASQTITFHWPPSSQISHLHTLSNHSSLMFVLKPEPIDVKTITLEKKSPPTRIPPYIGFITCYYQSTIIDLSTGRIYLMLHSLWKHKWEGGIKWLQR